MPKFITRITASLPMKLTHLGLLIGLFSLSGLLWANTTNNLRALNVDPHKYKEGKQVFMSYCSKCHGINADGRGRMAPLYRRMKTKQPSNFTVRFYQIRPTDYLKSIVRDGGAAHHLSEYMPPFGSELDETTLDDVIYFVQSVSKVKFTKRELKK